MGMYNPTNTRCQMMSYLDADSPQYMYGSRQSFYEFLDTVLTTGYNTKEIQAAELTEYDDELAIKLTYASTHGYRLGHLLDLSGSTQTEYTGIFRVMHVEDDYNLYLGNLDESIEYPSITSSPLISKVAPLDWEIVYSTSSQRSYRSKMENSSKNVITLKMPTHPSHLNSNSAIVHAVEVSKDINLTNGAAIDSYTSFYKHVGDSASQNLPYDILYHPQHLANESNTVSSVTPGSTARAPWYFVGDGRIFYLIYYVGNNSSPTESDYYSNYQRLPGKYMYRNNFAFGDPNAFDENDIYEGNGTILSTAAYSATLNTYYTRSVVKLGASGSSSTYFMKTYDGTSGLPYADLRSINGTYVETFASSLLVKYPNLATGGYIFYPYTMYSSGPSIMDRAFLPYLKYCDLDVSDIYKNPGKEIVFDWNPIIGADKTITTFAASYNTSSHVYGSYIFNVGR